MHILSELRNPLFNAPDRERALRALQMSRVLRENNTAKAWLAVKNMIDKAVTEHNFCSPRMNTAVSPRHQLAQQQQQQQQQQQRGYVSPSLPSNVGLGAGVAGGVAGGVGVYPTMQETTIPSYPTPLFSSYDGTQTLQQQPQQRAMQPQPQPDLLVPSSSSTMQHDHDAPSWDDINLTNIQNIVGDVNQLNPGTVPDFDFVSLTSIFLSLVGLLAIYLQPTSIVNT
jgi:hypothetical protein